MDRVYLFLLHSLESVYYVLLMSHLRSILISNLRILYEKKRAFTAIMAVLSSSSSSSSSTSLSSFHQLLDLADEKTNVALVEEIATLIHKEIDFSLQSDIQPSSSSSSSSAAARSSSPSSSSLTSIMSVNEIIALIGDEHVDGATYIEKLSVEFEEFETYFLAIFENRKRCSYIYIYIYITIHTYTYTFIC